ncbi:MAG: hypothetical protein ACUVTB_06865 [Candidatus Bathycorpusculaceae bacterium]
MDEKKFLVVYNREEFKKAIDKVVEMFAKELKKRYLKKTKKNSE